MANVDLIAVHRIAKPRKGGKASDISYFEPGTRFSMSAKDAGPLLKNGAVKLPPKEDSEDAPKKATRRSTAKKKAEDTVAGGEGGEGGGDGDGDGDGLV